jgi:hypothetical protein
LAFQVGFVLTCSQVAVQKSAVATIEGNLRTVGPAASWPAGKDQKGKAKNYGQVRPLPLVFQAGTIRRLMEILPTVAIDRCFS